MARNVKLLLQYITYLHSVVKSALSVGENEFYLHRGDKQKYDHKNSTLLLLTALVNNFYQHQVHQTRKKNTLSDKNLPITKALLVTVSIKQKNNVGTYIVDSRGNKKKERKISSLSNENT